MLSTGAATTAAGQMVKPIRFPPSREVALLLNDETYRLDLLISVILGSPRVVKNVWPLIFKGNVQHDWSQNENLRESDAKISFTKQNLGWLDASAIATHMGQTHSYDL